MSRSFSGVVALLCAALWYGAATQCHAQTAAADEEALGVGLEGFVYPYPVQFLLLRMEGVDVKMAFMDVEPTAAPNGRTVLLMHGRNFYGAYWKDTIRFLSSRGYRTVVPDQIGFGKSSKPDVPHSFHVHASNTKQLLDYLGVSRVTVIGHSLGGMMAARFALMYPEMAERIVLEAPLGLEDYRLHVPFATRDDLAAEARKQTFSQIEGLFKGFFVEWKEEWQIFPSVHYRWTLGAESGLLARTAAHTYTMAYEQPTLYELGQIKSPALLIVGDKDRTALGRNRVSAEVRAKLGNMPELARKAADTVPNGKAVVLPDVGHVPHLETTERFHEEITRFIEAK